MIATDKSAIERLALAPLRGPAFIALSQFPDAVVSIPIVR